MVEPVYYWICGSCFTVGIVVGLLLAWIGSERSEKYIRRMIDHGSANIHTIMQQMMNTRIKQDESLLKQNQDWRVARYDTLRAVEKDLQEVTYDVGLPPESLMTNFCPEDYMLELRKCIRNHKLNYNSLLPWFRSAMMAGYSQGKNIAIVASKKKGRKK